MKYGPKPWIQGHWDWRAAGNFILGGTGAGLIVFAAVSLAADQCTIFSTAIGAVLVAVGLTCVWLEIGRPLRALHVFFNPQTSWMSREAIASLPLFALVAVALAMQSASVARWAALFALAFAFCQGRLLQAARGIPAWRAPLITPFVLATAFAEGAGVYLALGLFIVNADGVQVALGALLAIVRLVAWQLYLRQVIRCVGNNTRASLVAAGTWVTYAGTALPLALFAAGFVLPQYAPLLCAIGGVAMAAAGWNAKFTIVTRASHNQGFSLPHIPVRGAR